MRFTKMQGAGNDYVYVDCFQEPLPENPAELARHLMEDIRPGFGERADLAGGLITAGKNFGCGSSREHAPLAIQAAGIGAVVAASFARIFMRNAINIGLPILECPEAGRRGAERRQALLVRTEGCHCRHQQAAGQCR